MFIEWGNVEPQIRDQKARQYFCPFWYFIFIVKRREIKSEKETLVRIGVFTSTFRRSTLSPALWELDKL